MEKKKTFLKLSEKEMRVLFDALGYDVRKDGFVYEKDTDKKVLCHYTQEPLDFQKASILPGSTILINTSLITLSEYVTEFAE